MENIDSSTVIFVSQSLPGSSALVNHSFRFAKALSLNGLNPLILVDEDNGNTTDIDRYGNLSYIGIRYVPVGGYSTTGSNYFKKLMVFLGFGNPSLRYLRQLSKLPIAIILQAPKLPLYLRFQSWCKNNKVQLILETMEWHDRNMYKHRIIDWLDAEFRMKIIQKHHGKIIVISRYLENYYHRNNSNVFILPPVIDTNDMMWMPSNDHKDDTLLRLICSGSLIRDRQDIILAGILRAKRHGLRIILEYVGTTREQMISMFQNSELLDALGNSIVFHGVVPYEKVSSLLLHADYAVLLREDARWSRACFPSKVPEFLSLGLPLICNLTSDLGEYLTDGDEAFIINDLTEQAFFEAIRRASFTDFQKRKQMRVKARQRAVISFDINRYSKHLSDFIVQ